MRDLNDLIPAGSGWVFAGAAGINDVGQVVGYGYRAALSSTTPHALLLTPTP